MDAGVWRELIESMFADTAGKKFVRKLAAHTAPGFLLVDAHGCCLYANQAMQILTGFSAEEFALRPVHDLLLHHYPDGSPFPKKDSPLHRAFISRSAFKSDKELHFYRKDGSTFHAFCQVTPVRQEQEVICMVMEVRDVAFAGRIDDGRLQSALTLQLAADAAKIGTWESDLATGLVRQCAQTSQILGFGNEPTLMPARELEKMIVPEDRDAFNAALEAAREHYEPFDLEFRIRRMDGQMRWIATRGMNIRDETGRVACVSGIMFDISEKKQAQEKLRAVEMSYQLATEAANIGTWELDLGTGISTLSPIAIQMLALPPDKATLLPNEWRGLIFHEDRPLVMEAQEAALQSAEPFRLEFRMLRTDGKLVWVHSRGTVKKDAQGRPVKALGVMMDITQKKEAEASSLQGSQRLSLILETCIEGIFGIDADFRCTFMNKAGASMLGFEDHEMIGQVVHERMLRQEEGGGFFRPEKCRLVQAMDSGSPLRVEDEFLLRKNGVHIPVSYSVSPIVRDGRTFGAVVAFTDISERRQAEARAKQAAQEASAAAETNAKFRTFFEQGSHFSGVMTPDGVLIETNRLSLEMCGYERAAVIGKKFWECGWWNRSPDIMERVRRLSLDAAAGRASRQEITYFWADGSEHVSDLSFVPVTDAHGKVLYVAPTGIDVTEKINYAQALRRSEERFRSLTEFSPDAILVEQEGRFVYGNMAAATLFGVDTMDALIGRRSFDFIDAEFYEMVKAHRALDNEAKRRAPLLDLHLRRLDGSMIFAQAACGNVVWEDKPAVQIMLRDVSELKQTQDKLRHISERLQLAIEGSGEGIWDWDIPANRFTFSGGLNRILGRTKDATRGEAVEWRNAIHPDDYSRVIATFQDALAEKTPRYECEYRLRTKDGSWKWIWARGVIVQRDAQGQPTLMTGTLSDITARKESDELAWRHANLDALTGLPNRRLFRERLEQDLLKVKRSNHSLAVLFIDLDGFKQVNDLHGHDAGDLLLMESARRLKSCVRETDTVARLGGDEFTVILTELANLDHVEFVCQKILASLAETFHLGKDIGYISGSIGVSLYPMDAATPEELIRKADQAMYAAKHSGKNQFNYFTREMDERAHTRLRITNELRHALRNRELEVHYQPVVELRTGQVAKAEALLRWKHPSFGYISPTEFIPMAEESGLIKQIGNWVFKQAAVCCRQCMDQAGMPFQIGVNKSPIQFMSRDVDTNWLRFMHDQGLPPSSISVEITEGVLLHASEKVENRLNEYRAAGVEVALDDFGTGYSSMSYLQKFQIDYVKIDQSFVHSITSDSDSRTIAETIIIMAHKLGKKVIAEGIETQEQLECLAEAGCDYGQGFLFSYPVSSERLVEMVARQSLPKPHLM